MRDAINILLIEDDEIKRQSVLTAIARESPTAKIVTAHSVRKAIDTLSSETFDLVVADMSLPTFDIEIRERGGTPRPFGGIEVFEHLERIESPVPVLVVTSYPVLSDGKKSLSVKDLQQQLRRDFPNNFAGIIYFDSAYSDWERDIQRFFSTTFG
jgi:DNA-binding NarL/FixJ family response regulator